MHMTDHQSLCPTGRQLFVKYISWRTLTCRERREHPDRPRPGQEQNPEPSVQILTAAAQQHATFIYSLILDLKRKSPQALFMLKYVRYQLYNYELHSGQIPSYVQRKKFCEEVQ